MKQVEGYMGGWLM